MMVIMMTEKRFTIDKAGGVFYIFDNGTLLPINDGEPIVELLNELHEENEQLKEENKELRQYLSWQDMELEEIEDAKRCC